MNGSFLNNASLKPSSGAAILLAVTALTTQVSATPILLIPSSGPSPFVQPIAAGDVPTVPRRRGGRRSKEKDKPYQPLAKDPAAESETAHKDYLKRYGF